MNIKLLSVPEHISRKDKSLWSIPSNNIEWKKLSLNNSLYVVSGSAFIDISDPLGEKGNSFSVIIGYKVVDLSNDEKKKIANDTGTPETIFINNVGKNGEEYLAQLTVLTPTGKELGACAHGFIGAIQTTIMFGLVPLNSMIRIQTTLDTSARVYISMEGVISLEFKAESKKVLKTNDDEIKNILGVSFLINSKQPVYSVGSPKLMIEVDGEQFESIRSVLRLLEYSKLLEFQKKYEINGIHIYSRNTQGLPIKSMQINAYLGENNLIDPATGVSNAAQILFDESIRENMPLKVTQYIPEKPSAILVITKLKNGKVLVGGSAILINYKKLI